MALLQAPHAPKTPGAQPSRPWLSYLIIIGAFFALAALFSYPRLQGKVLSQHDNVSWKAMAQEAMAYHKATGANTLWSNSMFGGMPTYTTYVPESKNFLGPVYLALTTPLLKPINFFLLAMLSFFALTQALRLNKWIGAIASVAFAFSSYNPIIIAAGHDTKMFAIGFMPLALAGLIMLFRGRLLAGAAVTGLGAMLVICTAHYQIVYYLIIVLLAAGIAMLIQAMMERKGGRGFMAGAIALVCGGLAAGTHAGILMPTMEYNKETMRGGGSEVKFLHDQNKSDQGGGLDKEYAFRWSNGVGESFCALVPYLYGGGSGESADKMPETAEITGVGDDQKLPGYWGDQPYISGPVYFGAVICFLFVLGLLVVRGPHKWWMLAACIIGFVMSCGRNLPGINYWLFDHLPMLNKFRTPSMILAIPAFLFPLLGAIAVQRIMTSKRLVEDPLEKNLLPADEKSDLAKQVLIAAGITAGLALLVGVGGGLFFDFTSAADKNYGQIIDALKEDRAAMARNSGLKSAFFILAAAGALWLYIKDRLSRNIMLGAVAALICIDLLSVAHNYLNKDNYAEPDEYETAFAPRPVDQQILQDRDPYYRVFDISSDPFNNAIPAYYHKLIGGYSPAKLERMQDLIDVHLSKGFTAPVLDMLNTKYLIVPGRGQGGGEAVLPNPTACGNAWFVSEVKMVTTADDEILGLKGRVLGDTVVPASEFDPRKTAIIRTDFQDDIKGYSFGKDSASNVSLTKYGLNDLSFRSSNRQAGLAVFSDIWYPHGWEATIDGKPAKILRANYLLRALKVPAGDHAIEFHFRPKTFETGNNLAMVSSLGLIMLAIVAAAIVARKRKQSQNHVA